MTRKTWVPAGAVVVAAATIAGGAVIVSDATPATSAAPAPSASTAKVTDGELSSMVTLDGILTYRARSDGSPYAAINRARGTYTELPDEGDRVGCGAVLYRVDDNPVLLLCGSTPAYRSLAEGDSGRDVAELNANLVDLGYATRAQLHRSSHRFSSATASALGKLQAKRGGEQTGSLALGQAVFLPEPVRIARVTGVLGGSAPPGGLVAQATSGALEVQVDLDASQQSDVQKGDRARITLPGNASVQGRVERLGRVARVPGGRNGNAGDASIPAYIGLDTPVQARGLDRAPVQVQITTEGVKRALSVPVTALVGKAGGGFAVELVRAGGRRELAAVTLGLFDTAGGRVQVEGDLRAGDAVVVPSP